MMKMRLAKTSQTSRRTLRRQKSSPKRWHGKVAKITWPERVALGRRIGIVRDRPLGKWAKLKIVALLDLSAVAIEECGRSLKIACQRSHRLEKIPQILLLRTHRTLHRLKSSPKRWRLRRHRMLRRLKSSPKR